MLKYIELRWSNCFSYGEDNVIRFDENPITQLVGKNGHGKSSIALILEEVQFNKNSKGIKKGSILNRNNGSKSYSIELDFSKDGDIYTISTTRGSTQKVSFKKNSEDISSHTATSTFKEIEKVLGFDHNTFSQIVYQSSTSSLEFLTATDTQRKKFLIELLNLSRYADVLDKFKAIASVVSKEVTALSSKCVTMQEWIDKYKDTDLTISELLEIPDDPKELEARWSEIRSTISNVSSIAASIKQNNKYRELRDSIILLPAPTEQISQQEIDKLREGRAVLASQIAAKQTELKKYKGTKTNCPTCGASLDVNHTHLQDLIQSLQAEIVELNNSLDGLGPKLDNAIATQKANLLYKERLTEYEKYHALFNPEMDSEPPSVSDLEDKALAIQLEIKESIKNKKLVIELNNATAAKNAKAELIAVQLEEVTADLKLHGAKLDAAIARSANLQVLVKAFSTTGLVAYKIEGLVKELEDLTNEHLAEMSDGRFLLGFEITSSDKLNVVISDNGENIDINALSSGERARVNIATLLAIRKLMQSLSSTKTNLLILDETVENLDAEGKEKLIEVLLAEEELNTILISHSFTHPLIERVAIIKEDNVSRIEYNG